jgi:hypothetical protein
LFCADAGTSVNGCAYPCAYRFGVAISFGFEEQPQAMHKTTHADTPPNAKATDF